MRITTIQNLKDKLNNFDKNKPVVVTYQGVMFNIEKIIESNDGFIVLATGFNAVSEEDGTV